MKVNDIESQDVGSKGGTSINTKDQYYPLLKRIRGMFERMERPLTSECCIYRIPKRLHEVNFAAYLPQLISIGPFHHGKKEVQTMEKHKETFLSNFIGRAEVSLEVLVTSIKECKERVRGFYAETIEMSSDDFVEMVLLDGGFVIEYLLRHSVYGFTNENDAVLYKPWLRFNIRKDLVLLENQLPFFVIEKLYNLAFSIDPNDQSKPFLALAFNYFSNFNRQNKSPQGLKVKHFTDLVRHFHLPSSPRLPPTDNKRNQFSYSASELHEAGVKFKVGSSKCSFDIQFTNGVIQMPHFLIEDDSESVIRNLMALEQCHYPDNTYMCDYIFLMDTLINTAKDVELLTQKRIIVNYLGSNDVLATLFNNLCLEITENVDASYFSGLCEDLTEYYKNPWNSWKATLKRDYFSTPWRIASTVAAVILLILTLMQTINSFIGL